MTEANQKEPKPNVAGGRRTGGGHSAGAETNEASLLVGRSVCLLASGLQHQPHPETV